MDKIEIIINGKAKTGKSTIANAIDSLLTKNGINTIMPKSMGHKKLSSLKSKVLVNINENS